MSGILKDVEITWKPLDIILSYLISMIGSYTTILLIEAWRFAPDNTKRWFLFLSSLSLGGAGIWCMHFSGMHALTLKQKEENKEIIVDYEGFMTLFSLIISILTVFFGLTIASKDAFFKTVISKDRVALIENDLKNKKMVDIVNKKKARQSIQTIALLHNLVRIYIGGLLAALGVLSMHYSGMLAQEAPIQMDIIPGIFILSCLIAFFTATAAFWIVFRVLTFWPQNEFIRVSSAVIMGAAVCATHYAGMYAIKYHYNPEMEKKKKYWVLDGRDASRAASYLGLIVCYYLVTHVVLLNLKRKEKYLASSSDPNSNVVRNKDRNSNTRQSDILSGDKLNDHTNDNSKKIKSKNQAQKQNQNQTTTRIVVKSQSTANNSSHAKQASSISPVDDNIVNDIETHTLN